MNQRRVALSVACAAGLLLIALGGCYNRGMVGAANTVTGGRVFKVDGAGQIEQQLIMELQSLNVMPGAMIRYGGFGDTGSMYLLEYGAKNSFYRIETFDVPDDVDGETIVADIGKLIQKIDEDSAELLQAQYSFLVELAHQRELEKSIAEANTKAVSTSAATSAGAARWDDSTVMLGAFSDDAANETNASADSTKAKTDAEAGGSRGSDRAQPKTATNASLLAGALEASRQRSSELAGQMKTLRGQIQTNRQTLKDTASATGAVIFRWEEKRSGSASLSGGDMLKAGATDDERHEGFAVLYGLRRIRLVVGRDLDAMVQQTVDPLRDLVAWFEEPWSGTGLVTQVLQARHVGYFSVGRTERTAELLLNATPKELAGLIDSATIAELKLLIALQSNQLTSVENRGILSTPANHTEPVAWNELRCWCDDAQPGDGHTGWHTVLAAATSMKLLRDQGRLRPQSAAASSDQR